MTDVERRWLEVVAASDGTDAGMVGLGRDAEEAAATAGIDPRSPGFSARMVLVADAPASAEELAAARDADKVCRDAVSPEASSALEEYGLPPVPVHIQARVLLLLEQRRFASALSLCMESLWDGEE